MKNFLLVICLIFCSIWCCSCREDKAAILFNKEQITQENVMNYSFEFAPNQRIYYLVLIPKKINTRMIEIQIIKQDNQYETFGHTLYWSHSARLREDQMYYYDDYVVIPQTGAYIMKVYSKDQPTTALCNAQFFVRNF